MFGIFKKKNAPKQFKNVDVVVGLIFSQLPICGHDPITLANCAASDNYVLGYLFGIADMGNYQFNNGNSDEALSYVNQVFDSALGGSSDDLLDRALSMQSDAEFANGRHDGANDLGNWLKTKGQIVPMRMANYLSD